MRGSAKLSGGKVRADENRARVGGPGVGGFELAPGVSVQAVGDGGGG